MRKRNTFPYWLFNGKQLHFTVIWMEYPMTDEQKPKIEQDYQLATFKDRVLAYLVDLVILSTLGLVIGGGYFCLVYLNITASSIPSSYLPTIPLLLISLFFVGVLVNPFFDFFFEIILKGQTPGKILRNIKVVRLDNLPLKFNNRFGRWLLRPFGVNLFLVVTIFLTIQYLKDFYGISSPLWISNALLVTLYGSVVTLFVLKVVMVRKKGI